MKMMKRVLSLVLCFVMLAGMLPMEALAIKTDENGATVYEIGDSVWVRGEENDPTGACAPGTFWLPDYDGDRPVTRQGLCEKTEHTHVFVCPDDCALAHQHGESCYVTEYTGCTIHAHDETCAAETVYDCGKEQHENHDSCTASQVCTVEEHDHAALNCATEVRFTCETEVHTHSAEAGCPYKTVFTCTEAHEHSEELGCARETRCICTKAEHTHSVEAGCANETVYTCGKDNHTHSESCTLTTVYGCSKEIHTHDETCATKQVYPNCTEHTEHNESCATQQKLNCGKDEHACTTEGCAADCAIEEHTHSAECDMEGVYYKWTVVEDTSSTLESTYGLPIHFFIAEPGEAIDPDGAYVNYKKSYWGNNNDTSHTAAYSTITSDDIKNNKGKDNAIGQIATEQGIRNTNNEATVTQYIAKLHNSFGTDMAAFKDFGSMTFQTWGGSTTYYDTEYEIKWVTICYRSSSAGLGCYCGVSYEHIHIDGVLSKKITPAEMKLTKTIPADQVNATNQESFKFELTKLQHDSNGKPTQNVDTSFGTDGSIELVANIAAGKNSASIVSPTGEEIGFGFYKLTEIVETDSRWQTSAIKIKYSNNNTQTAPTDDIYIQIGTDGTFRFCGTLNGEYAQAQEIIIENERKPLEITYSWEGIPDGLATLPEKSTVEPGDAHSINTSWPVGARVRGKSGVVDSDGKKTEGYYYEFLGWQYYDPVGGNRTYIQYNNGNPGQITDIDSNVNVHGLWVRHELEKADGYITITKTFVNKPTGDALDSFYIAVIHGTHETDISPKLIGTWNADGTQWTYDFAISESSTYKIVEGKYDVAGYAVTPNSTFTKVEGISEGTPFTGGAFESDGHKYTEFGQEVTVDLPYDTSTLDGVAGVAETPLFYAGTVAFTNEYTKKMDTVISTYPDFQVRKWDADYSNRLTGATFALTKTDTNETITGVEMDATMIFEDLQPGQYTLIETAAPEGYIKTEAVYNFIVQLDVDNEIEELQMTCGETHTHTTACYEFVKIQPYKIVMEGYENEGFEGRYNPDLNRLNIPNTQIQADLKLTKTFHNKTQNTNFVPDSGSVLVDIYGPVVRDSQNVVTSVGPQIRTDLPITKDAEGEWTVTVENLPYGEYYIEEVLGSIHGYTWEGVSYGPNLESYGNGALVKIDSTNDVAVNITNTYEKWTSVDFYILKEDLGGKQLPGAVFELKNLTTNEVQTGTTNDKGLIHFAGFTVPDGADKVEYSLKEVQAPAGYYLTGEAYKVVVTKATEGYDIKVVNADDSETGDWDVDDDVLTVVDTPILGEITVQKNFAGDTVPEGNSVTFALLSADGTVRRTATIAEKDGWKHTFKDLPLGAYTLTETAAEVPGYAHTTQYQINNDAAITGTAAEVVLRDDSDHKITTGTPDGAKASVVFTNEYDRQETVTVNADSLTIFKRDEKGEDLAGAKFGLFKDAECKTPLTSNDVSFATTATSNAYGQARFTDMKLASGEELVFYLTETEAPYGYVRNETVWKLKLSNEKVEILNNQNIFETIVDWITGLWKPKDDSTEYEWVAVDSLAVTNQRIKGTLTVNKLFAGVTDYSDARVEVHVHGPITRDANNKITDIGPLVKNINLAGGDWNDVVSNLEVGEYVIREPFASVHGYTWDKQNVTYIVDGNSVNTETVTGKSTDELFAAFTVDADNTAITIDITNTYTAWDAADFTVNKVKDITKPEDGLSGATFQLYTKDSNGAYVAVPKNDKFTTEATTGSAGYAEFKGFTVDSGKTATYYLKETNAPENYKLTDLVWKVVITHDDSDYKVSITKESGTGESGTDFLWVEERDTLNVVNKEILGELTITKNFVNQPKDEDGKLLPAKIEVRVVGPNGYDETVTLEPSTEAGKNWTETLSGLHMGTYYVTEGDASAPGYTLTTTGYAVSYGGSSTVDNTAQPGSSHATVELTENTTKANVVITNSYTRNEELKVSKASFQVKKVDADNDTKVLAGAKFALFESKTGPRVGDVVETDSNGIAEFTNIPLIDPEDEKSFGYYTDPAKGQTVTYILREIDAPDGYRKSDTEWTVTLSEKLDKATINKLNPNTNFFETVVDWIINGVKPNGDSATAENVGEGILTVPNQRIEGKIKVSKSFSFKDSNDKTVTIDDSLKQKINVELYVYGPVVWKDSTKTEIASIGEGRPIVLKGSNMNDAGTITAELGNLPLGDYLVRETRIFIQGYNWVSANFGENHHEVEYGGHKYLRVEVEEDSVTETAPDVNIICQNSYKAWTPADFHIHKTDENGKELAGATFGLFTRSGNAYVAVKKDGEDVTAVTGSDGLAHFSGLTIPNGDRCVYYVMETAAPAGYHKNDTVWSVTVIASEGFASGSYNVVIDDMSDNVGVDESVDTETDTITVVNRKIKATLTITKVLAGDELPAGTFVKPSNQNGTDSTSDDKLPKIVVRVTGPGPDNIKDYELYYENGKMERTLTGLELGTYTVTEITANAKVPGYDLIQTTYQVDDNAGNTVDFTGATEDPEAEIVITNTYDRREAVVNNPDQLTIHKKDDAGKSLPGAKFRLTNDHNAAFVREFVTDDDGKVVVDNLIGVGGLNSYANVTYTLEEIEAPTGHELSEKRTWQIKIVEADEEQGNVQLLVVLNEQNNTWETIWDWIIGDKNNDSWDAASKTLTVVNKRKMVPLSIKKTVEIDGQVDPATDAYVQSLKDIKYKFELEVNGNKETVELKADETFTKNIPYGSTYAVKEIVATDAAFTVSMSNNADGSIGTTELTGVTVEATNTYKIQDVTPLTLDFIKVSTGRTATPLKGAKFELYDSADKRLKSYTTGKDGKFRITEITEPGTYELIETAAPSGYHKLKKAITITASYDYQVVENASGDPEIAKRLVATVAGSTSYQVSDSNDFYYGIKNTPITEVSDTGDEAELLFWGGMTTVSLLCMAIMLFVPRKKGKYQQ